MSELSVKELRTVKRYQKDSGCAYPATPCDFCEALIAGMRGQPCPDDSDSDVVDAYRKGQKSRARLKGGQQ